MAIATTSDGIRVVYPGHVNASAFGYTSSSGLTTLTNLQFKIIDAGDTPTQFTVAASTSVADTGVIMAATVPATANLLVTAGTVIGGQGAPPPISMMFPLYAALKATALELNYKVSEDTSTSGTFYPITAGSTTITIPINRGATFYMSGYSTAIGVKLDADIHQLTASPVTTGGNFTITTITGGTTPNQMQLITVSTGSDTFQFTANPFDGLSTPITFGNVTFTVIASVAESLTIDYSASTS